MSQLFRFLSRYTFFIIFLLIEGCAFALIINKNEYQNSVFFRFNNMVTGSFFTMTSNIADYFSLKSENELLATENVTLQNQLLELQSAKAQTSFSHFGDSAFCVQSAKVIYNTINRLQNYLILDKGDADGVSPNMGVITPQGVVGKVISTSKHFCTVVSVLNTESTISGKIKNSNYLGTISWNGLDPTIVQMEDMPRHINFTIGDTIITSGHSAIFMEGAMIGTVIKADIGNNDAYYNVDILLSNHFQALTYVNIISFKYREEYDEIEKVIFNA